MINYVNVFRKILFPLSVLYWLVTYIRNYLYDKGYFHSTSFNIPIIAVGNLSVGGTGKTPMVEYLIRMLSHKYNIAVLSRGYKRKTKGFVLADESSTAQSIGDEPYQYFSKFENITVAVDENRVNGVQNILQLNPKINLIILDDAYQHRKIKASKYILLTAYHTLYVDDCLLPAGNLRESIQGAKRADIVVVTKCPKNISIQEKERIRKKLKLEPFQKLYCTTIEYDEYVYNANNTPILLKDIQKKDFLAVTGIAKPQYFYRHISVDDKNVITYPDHHNFSDADIEKIKFKADKRIIITTEKDFVKLKEKISYNQLYYLPIKIKKQ